MQNFNNGGLQEGKGGGSLKEFTCVGRKMLMINGGRRS